MKPLSFFISEKLKLSKETGKSSHKAGFQAQYTKVNLPVYDMDNGVLKEDEIWKTWNVPVTKYIVFVDKYRGNLLHFATLCDFLCSVEFFQNDFEDFDPEKEIVFGSDDMGETLEWYIEKLGMKDEFDEVTEMVDKGGIDDDEAYDQLESLVEKKKILNNKVNIKGGYDNLSFLWEFHKGTPEDEKEYLKTDQEHDFNEFTKSPQEYLDKYLQQHLVQ